MTERSDCSESCAKDRDDEEVICPKPQRFSQLFPSPELIKALSRHRNMIATNVGDTVLELLDIFFSKNLSLGGSPPYFCGSPPTRASNPLIHDVQFHKQQLSPAAHASLQRSSSSESPHRFSPAVRVEGFMW